MYSYKERNVLFNDTQHFIYGYMASHIIMVKDHSDSKRGNPLLPHGLLFPISSKGSYMHHLTDRITHTTALVTCMVIICQMTKIKVATATLKSFQRFR